MIEGVMSIMEEDEGMNKQKYKELLLFSNRGTQKNWDTEKLGHRKIGTQKNWGTEKLRDREYTEILRNLERKRY